MEINQSYTQGAQVKSCAQGTIPVLGSQVRLQDNSRIKVRRVKTNVSHAVYKKISVLVEFTLCHFKT